MMKKGDKKYLLSSLLCLIPIVVGMLFYKVLPRQMTTYWSNNGMHGEYTSKIFVLFCIPLIIFLVDFLFKFLLVNDPKKSAHSKFLLRLYKYLLPVVSAFITVFNIYYSKYYEFITVDVPIFITVGVVFVVFGYFMPSIGQNYTMGIKLPWTLTSVKNWEMTHDFAKNVYIISGLIIIILGVSPFNLTVKILLLFLDLLITISIPSLYSYMLYRNSN